MATEYKIENRNLYIYLDGELDHHLAKKIKYQCDIILKSYPIKDIEFDFTNSPFIDSSGIGVIMGRYKRIYMLGGEVCAVHANERMKKILTMSGVTKIMQIYEEEK